MRGQTFNRRRKDERKSTRKTMSHFKKSTNCETIVQDDQHCGHHTTPRSGRIRYYFQCLFPVHFFLSFCFRLRSSQGSLELNTQGRGHVRLSPHLNPETHKEMIRVVLHHTIKTFLQRQQRNSTTNSRSRRQMAVNGQHYAPSAFTREQGHW